MAKFQAMSEQHAKVISNSVLKSQNNVLQTSNLNSSDSFNRMLEKHTETIIKAIRDSQKSSK